ncbi:MAG TPA: DUF4347 domain-containing protein [Noviherbaspirillum sp.]|nr:DUF4347 domain-containing protein [Noviherbaspirillum sp.]
MSARLRPEPFIVEALEPRILYSADSPLLLDGSIAHATEVSALSDHAAAPAPVAEMQSVVTANETRSHLRREIVFIDSSVTEAEELAGRIAADNTGQRSLEIFIIDASRDGVDQISKILSTHRDLDAMHIISHGQSGALKLGSNLLDSKSLLANATSISAWGDAVSADGDILIYGCDVAADQSGRDFVLALSQLTGADVSASTNLTGATALNGDWTLEHAQGLVETAIAPGIAAQAQFNGILATYTVANTNDSGAGSLRQAILDANANAGSDIINFNIGGGGLQTMWLGSALPDITDVVDIDGTTQPGFASAPLIAISGSAAGAGANGLSFVAGASGSSVRGLILHAFQGSAISISGVSNITIAGNYLGADATGLISIGNGKSGIVIDGGTNITIGGTVASDRNVIVGNSENGIRIASGTGNTIAGNYIGLNAAGTGVLGNGWSGVYVSDSSNSIGGAVAGAGNAIAGNVLSGVHIDGGDNNTVQGNIIGLNAAGTSGMANGRDGIEISNGSGNTVGGTAVEARNVVSGNVRYGIAIQSGSSGNTVQGNYVGTAADGSSALGNGSSGMYIHDSDSNTIGGTAAGARNIFSGNSQQGIVIGGTGTSNVVQGNYVGLNAVGTGSLANGSNGVHVTGSGNTIGGAVAGASNAIAGNVLSGVHIDGGDNNTVQGNIIGLNAAGTSGMTNGRDGIEITNGSGNAIGGTAANARNVVSGNVRYGIAIQSGSSSNTVLGNYVGIGADGSSALGNGSSGMYIHDSDSNTIGGTAAGARNIISGNSQQGIVIGGTSTSNVVQGNYIGLSAAGTAGLGNGSNGVHMTSSGNTIGGAVAGAGNAIAGNVLSGVHIDGGDNNTVQGNIIGLNAAGTGGMANGRDGIEISDGSGNTIGGTAAGARNVVSGNVRYGIAIQSGSNGNTVLGNYVGLNPASTGAFGNGQSGVYVAGTGNIIGGTAAGAGNAIAGNVLNGLHINGGSNNIVQGNTIGMNAAGTVAYPNGGHGVYLQNGANNNTIGSGAAGAGNIISGNLGHGIRIDGSTGNSIKGNVIGLNAAGNAAAGNTNNGIVIENASDNNVVGGSGSGEANSIAGNGAAGIRINGSSGTSVQGNYIGTNAAGDSGLGNGGQGIYLDDAAANSLIGGTAASQGNVIAHNALQGIAAAWTNVTGNCILGNSIYSNTGLGIDIGNDGVSANDANDADAVGNGNGMQNFPLIASAYVTGANVMIAGTLNSSASRTYRLEFFANTANDGSNHGQGKVYLGSVNAISDASGNATFTFTGTGAAVGEWISATATDLTTNETSEFALDVQAQANNAPSITSDGGGNAAAISLPEGTTAVTTATAADIDGDTPTFSISGGADAAKFVINSTTGALSFIAAPDFEAPGDADNNNSYIVQISVSDGKGGNDTQLITTTVSDVNDTPAGPGNSGGPVSNTAPAGANKTVSTLEDQPYTFTAADFGFSDADGNAFLAARMTTVPISGVLAVNGITVNAGDYISKNDIDLGRLVYTPAANANGSASFTFQVQDNGGTANGGTDLDPTANTMTLDVIPVNDPPAGSDKVLKTLEGAAYTFTATDFGFSDVDGNAFFEVKITTLPSHGTLTNTGVAVTAGSIISKADIDLGRLVLIPVRDTEFTFQVRDDGGTTAGGIDWDGTPNSIAIKIGTINKDPFGTDRTVTIREDAAYTVRASDFGFGDADGDVLYAVKIASLPQGGTLTVNGTTVEVGNYIGKNDLDLGRVVFTPAANLNGPGRAGFSFQVQDNGGTANGGVDLDYTANTITFDITPVNDAPAGADNTITTRQNEPYVFSASDFGFSDIDGHAMKAVKIVTVPNAGALTRNGVLVRAGEFVDRSDIDLGRFVFLPEIRSGEYRVSFAFQVQDDAGITDSGTSIDPIARTMVVRATESDVLNTNGDASSSADSTQSPLTTGNAVSPHDEPGTANSIGSSGNDGHTSTVSSRGEASRLDTTPGPGMYARSGHAVTAETRSAAPQKYSNPANGTLRPSAEGAIGHSLTVPGQHPAITIDQLTQGQRTSAQNSDVPPSATNPGTRSAHTAGAETAGQNIVGEGKASSIVPIIGAGAAAVSLSALFYGRHSAVATRVLAKVPSLLRPDTFSATNVAKIDAGAGDGGNHRNTDGRP